MLKIFEIKKKKINKQLKNKLRITVTKFDIFN